MKQPIAIRDEDTRHNSACLIERLQRPRKTCDGKMPDGTPIKWRLLSASDKQIARGKARKRLKEIGLDADSWMNADTLEQEMGWQMLALAMRDPAIKGTQRNPYPTPAAWVEDPKTRVKETDADKLRDLLSVHECSFLLDQYLDFEDCENPTSERLTDEELGAIAEAVKKKDRIGLKDFGADSLALYLITMVNQPSISPNGKSSSTLDSQQNP